MKRALFLSFVAILPFACAPDDSPCTTTPHFLLADMWGWVIVK